MYMSKRGKMTPGEKALLTRTLRKLYPDTADDGLKWDEYSREQIKSAKEFLERRKKNREKRKLQWTKMQIVKYLDFRGIDHDYTAKTVPKKMVDDFSKDNQFLAFKKLQGYRLLFRKIKGRSAKSNKEIVDFIKLLAKERKQKKKKMSD